MTKEEVSPPEGTGNQPEIEKKLTWKLKELPTADSIGRLVDTGVITPQEARDILFKEEEKQSDEVEALKEMVNTLQEMVKDLMNRDQRVNFAPYTRVIEVPRRHEPYWEKVWCDTSGTTLTATTGNRYKTNYTLSIG